MEKPQFVPLTDEQQAKMGALLEEMLAESQQKKNDGISGLGGLPYLGSFTRCFHHKFDLEDVRVYCDKLPDGLWGWAYSYWCPVCDWAVQGVVIEVTAYERLALGVKHKFAEHALVAEAFYAPVPVRTLIDRVWTELLGKLLMGSDISLIGGRWCHEGRQVR